MLSEWLRRRFEHNAARSGRVGLERFVASLRSQPENEIAMLVVVAAAIRVRLRDAGHLPDDVLQATSMHEYEQATVRQRVSRLVRKYQTHSEYIDAAGAMVWLHTLRSLTTPELRDLGRQMWQELQRGFPHTSDALARIETATRRASPPGTLPACHFIPQDLGARAGRESTTHPATQ
jgi:hypothetical protein